MSRSLKKGPFIDERVMKKVRAQGDNTKKTPIKTWSRACVIVPDMIGFTFQVHNGRQFIDVYVVEEMIGHRLGEFSPTRKFARHGGKIQKDLDQATKQRDIESARAAKSK